MIKQKKSFFSKELKLNILVILIIIGLFQRHHNGTDVINYLSFLDIVIAIFMENTHFTYSYILSFANLITL